MEIWKVIEGFHNYMVSNEGRIYSRKTNSIMKPTPDTKGYLRISFYENGKSRTFKVHRLVAQAFIPNPENLPQVNHKDENKSNNAVSNLEWCTNSYNRNYGTATERTRLANTNCKSTSAPVKCLETGEIFPSLMEAERKTGAKNIFWCCKGKRNTSGGFHWEYAGNVRRIDNRKVVCFE